jgi:uncharacterized protein YqhQ
MFRAVLLALAVALVAPSVHAQPKKAAPTTKSDDTKKAAPTPAEDAQKKKEAEESAKAVGGVLAGLAGLGLVGAILLGTVTFIVHLVPTFIALLRRHPNAAAIAAVNILLGWTCLGWIVAFVWSLTAVDRPRS